MCRKARRLGLVSSVDVCDGVPWLIIFWHRGCKTSTAETVCFHSFLTSYKSNCCVPHRDRENSTVFVADLPADTKEEDLSALFKDVCDTLSVTGIISHYTF